MKVLIYTALAFFLLVGFVFLVCLQWNPLPGLYTTISGPISSGLTSESPSGPLPGTPTSHPLSFVLISETPPQPTSPPPFKRLDANGNFYYDSRASTNRTNAICITGSRMHRLWDDTIFDALEKFVLNVSNPDLYLYGYYDAFDQDKLLSKLGKFIRSAVLKPVSSPAVGQITDFYKPLTHWMERDNAYSILKLHHLCYDGLVVKEVEERGFEYDVIMRARPDMLFQSPVNMSHFSTNQYLPELVLYTFGDIREGKRVPVIYWGATPGLSDQWSAGSARSMEIFANFLYTMMKEPSSGTNRFIEASIYEQAVKKFGMTLKTPDFDYVLSRG